jgi:hypothetical protein
MARTLRQDVEAYVGPVDGLVLEIQQWLSAGAAQLVDLIPPDRAEQYAVPLDIAASTATDITGKRILSVMVGGRIAKRISYIQYMDSLVTGSLQARTADDPGYYIMLNNIYSVPGTSTGEAIAISYPQLTGQDTSIMFPPEFRQPVILYASVQYLINAIKTLRATIPADIDTTNNVDLASKWTLLTTILDTNQDIELASAKLQEIQMYLQEMEIENKNVIQEQAANTQVTIHRIASLKENLVALQQQYTDALNTFIKIHYPTQGKE